MQGYEILGRLAAGAMGEVLLARKIDSADLVAVKRMLVRSDDAAAQLLEEARVCAAVAHPHVVGVVDVGADEDGPFLVLEYVHGDTLASLVERASQRGTALPVAVAVRAALDVAEGLAAAHARGIVHRDVKPSNVLIALDGQTRIADFGIARAAERLVQPTHVGFVRGTIRYMSPEQLTRSDADAKSDQFSLGVVLWEALCGRPLFSGPGALEHEVIRRIIACKAPRVREVRPDVPAKLDEVIARMLAKEPRDRYVDCHEVAAALAAAVPMTGAQAALSRTVTELCGASVDARLARLDERTSCDRGIHGLATNVDVEAPTLTALRRPRQSPRVPAAHESPLDVIAAELNAAELSAVANAAGQRGAASEPTVNARPASRNSEAVMFEAPTVTTPAPLSSESSETPPTRETDAREITAPAVPRARGSRRRRRVSIAVSAAAAAAVLAWVGAAAAIAARGDDDTPNAAARTGDDVDGAAARAARDARAAHDHGASSLAPVPVLVGDARGAPADDAAAVPHGARADVDAEASSRGARDEDPELPRARVDRRVVHAAHAKLARSSTQPAASKLVLGVSEPTRAGAEAKLRGCRVTSPIVGVIRARAGAVVVSSQPKNPCVEHALAKALRTFSGSDEPYQIEAGG